ncbi:BACON domain-containing protein [Pedobacter miscanthi]|uniref:BACON domain-containing protein n=1 Tax=Pedobacter miscanthi TaxID=2259170 RepID=UPI0029312BD1|nr:BACON domain-containing carbohydrate-binding protein [Pedobacter miscanthi]
MKRTLISGLAMLMIVLTNCSKDKNQAPVKPTLIIERDVYEYLNTNKTGNFAVSISDNSEWDIETLTTQSWISVAKKGGQVELTMEENQSLYERVAKIKVTSADKLLSKIVVVKQHGNTPTIIVDKPTLKLNNPADNGIVTINSNMNWSLSSDADWLSWEVKGGEVKLIATANPQAGERTAVVIINAESPVFNKSITVTQKGTIEFDVDKKNLQFSRDGGNEVITIETNQQWTYTISPTTTWFTVQRDGNKLTVLTVKNNFVDLSGTITISYGLINVVIQVKQTGIAIGTELDRQVLIAIYEKMGGANWSGTKWNINAPLEEATVTTNWNGITVAKVNGVDRVTRINLAARNLKGPIPPAIGYLSELILIDMNNNNQQLTGTIPPSMGNLRKLTSLTLSRSGLTGTIPVEFANLTTLNLLQMHTSNFTGPIPENVFSKMPNLTSLELKLNNFTGNIPADMLSHPKFANWNAAANLCPQNAGFGFTKCP